MKKYDAIVIGAGPSGLACALRLAMFDYKVALLEKHSVVGGLNSYYQRVRKDENGNRLGIRKFDVGLHALTNFVKKGTRGTPLTKILKQLRIPYDDFQLKEHKFSKVQFGDRDLKFSNDIEALKFEVREKFPADYTNFLNFLEYVQSYDDTQLDSTFVSAKKKLLASFESELFVEMILCPLLAYGSSWENDMDLTQFVILFKSIYLEGFARPVGGVRTLIDVVMKKMATHPNLDIFLKTPVLKMETQQNAVTSVHTETGIFSAKRIFTSVGLPETKSLLAQDYSADLVGKLSFVEVIYVYERKMGDDYQAAITFYNEDEKYYYEQPSTAIDDRSAIICIPDNYFGADDEQEGVIRLTFCANFEIWNQFSETEYEDQKGKVIETGRVLLKKLFPNDLRKLVYTDCFTPKTIQKFTSHRDGTVYGSPVKSRDGKTDYQNLFLIGSDQGYLGITGAMLSGIMMANQHGLSEGLS